MRIAVIGAGAMGAALGGILASRGAQVLSPLEGRSDASLERAAAAGIRDAGWHECAACDFVLSVVPSSQAMPVAERLSSSLPTSGGGLVFLECNAIAPDEARRIGVLLAEAGCSVIDAGILGGPPSPDGSRAPLIYLSGPDAALAAPLGELGLRLRDIDAPLGAASALKMALAGISKGQTALISMMLLVALREGVSGPFLDQLENSQPAIVGWGRAQIPQLGQKAGRWVEEMDILADFAADIPGGASQFSGLAEFYAAISSGDWSAVSLSELQQAIARKD